MTKQTTSAALERLEGLTADFIEENIAEVEKEQNVKVKDVEVVLIPDTHGASPTVTVMVST